MLEDVGLIAKKDSHRFKIRRESQKNQTEMSSQQLHGIYFDGRKDQILVIKTMESKQFKKTIKEGHYSIIKEHGSIYVGHVSPRSGSDNDIACSMLSFLNTNEFTPEDLDVVKCDGINSNSG